MHKELTVEEALKLKGAVFIDLRSPAEYKKGSIPGSLNIPLFDDQEREILGIIYQQDPHRARLKGLTLASSRLPGIIKEIEEVGRRGGKPVLYCWRGGLRSKSLFTLLEILDIPAFRLEKGYKAYRRFILEQLRNYRLTKPVFVLNGLTGVGKTEVLRLLAKRGCPTVDLEALACHRGSLFGHLGIREYRSQKDFDALLFNRLEELNDASYLLLEGEGKRIGNIYQPDFLFEAINSGKHILLTASLEKRVERLLQVYTPTSPEESQEVQEAIISLQKYLGKKTVGEMLSLLERNKFAELVSQLCTLYYDRLYPESKPGRTSFVLVVDASNISRAAEEIFNFIQEKVQDHSLRR